MARLLLNKSAAQTLHALWQLSVWIPIFTTPAVNPSQTRKRTSLCCCLKPKSLASPWMTQMEDLHTRNQIAMMKPWVIKCFPLRNGPTSQVTLKVEQPPWKTANRNPGCCKPPSVSHKSYGSVHNRAPFSDEDWEARGERQSSGKHGVGEMRVQVGGSRSPTCQAAFSTVSHPGASAAVRMIENVKIKARKARGQILSLFSWAWRSMDSWY